MNKPYTQKFFRKNIGGSSSSAEQIVSFITRLVQPKSVVDVGCGLGAWCAQFAKIGIADVIGLDGAYVDTSQLKIPRALFKDMDLELPIRLERSFDLAVSLEVAEHLSARRARSFVADLTRLAPIVLFSAAIPGQGGDQHINEQWQSYWQRLFADQGFRAIDCVRPSFWNNEQVEYWYRQNTLLYVRGEIADRFRIFGEPSQIDIVHPEYLRGMLLWKPFLGDVLRCFPGAFVKTMRRITSDVTQRA